MTISSQIVAVTRSWTGAETLFTTGLKAKSAADVIVTTATLTLTRDVHFSSELSDPDRELVIRPLASMPAAPQTLRIERRTPAIQPDDLANGNSYDADAQEDQFDRVIMVVQELTPKAEQALISAQAAQAVAQDAFDSVDTIVRTGPVYSVNGRQGNVVLAKSDLGLSNVENIAVTAYVAAAITNLINASPSALDTLNELAAALGDDPNFAFTMATALGNRLRADTNAQGLSGTQQANAQTNLGISAFIRTLLDDADVNTARATLALAAIAASGSASDLSTGTIPDARLPTRLGDAALELKYPQLAVGNRYATNQATENAYPYWETNKLAGGVGDGGSLFKTGGVYKWVLGSIGVSDHFALQRYVGAGGAYAGEAFSVDNSTGEMTIPSLSAPQYFKYTGVAFEGSLDGSNDRVPLWDASVGAYRLTSPAALAGTNTAGVGSFNGRSGTVSFLESDLPQRLGGSTIPTASDCLTTPKPGWYYFDNGSANRPFGVAFGFIFHCGDNTPIARRYAWDITNASAPAYLSIQKSGSAAGSWVQTYETAAEINGLSDARYLRKLSSGELTTADDPAIRHDGNPADAAVNTAALNTLMASLPSTGGVLEIKPGTIASNPLATISNKPISIDGKGGSDFANILVLGTSGNWLTVSQNSQNLRTRVRGLTGIKHSDGSTAGAFIAADYPFVASSSLRDTLDVEDIAGRSASGTTAFGALIRPNNAWHVRAHKITGEGAANNAASMAGLIDFKGKCTVAHIGIIKGYWAHALVAYEAGNFSEGLYLDQFHAVACNWALDAQNGTDAPGLHISNGHAETFFGGIRAISHPQLNLSSALFYKRTASTQNWAGLWLEGISGYGSNFSAFSNVQIWGAKGAAAGGTATALVLDDSDGTIGGNIVAWDCDLGADLLNNSDAKVTLYGRNITTASQNVPAGGSVNMIAI